MEGEEMKINPVSVALTLIFIGVYGLAHLYGWIELPERERDKKSCDSSHLVV